MLTAVFILAVVALGLAVLALLPQIEAKTPLAGAVILLAVALMVGFGSVGIK